MAVSGYCLKCKKKVDIKDPQQITMKNGKKAEIPVAGMFELDDAGKIRVWRDYFDLATFTKQIS